MMDLDAIIRELLTERKRLDRTIRALEQSMKENAAVKSRRGRKSMDGTARREVSARMKKYWASRRGEQGEQQPNPPESAQFAGSVYMN